ncbi:hypothetical protein Q3G72_033440 [Acer saccharum]|nr:hypothetical protein Q3G72_033440 [Acer saccharum]
MYIIIKTFEVIVLSFEFGGFVSFSLSEERPTRPTIVVDSDESEKGRRRRIREADDDNDDDELEIVYEIEEVDEEVKLVVR